MRIVSIALCLSAVLAQSSAALAAYTPSGTKIFTIEKRDDLGPFMCPANSRLLSAVVATQRGQSVALVYLDDKQKEVATDKWVSVSGFKLTKRPDQVLNAVMVCGA